jgi:hypothetical protein
VAWIGIGLVTTVPSGGEGCEMEGDACVGEPPAPPPDPAPAMINRVTAELLPPPLDVAEIVMA